MTLLSFSRSFIHGGSLLLYSSSWTILNLHLLIIWATTWVLVPSDTPSGFLWIKIVKAILFRNLFHINVVRKLVAWHSIRWQQLFLRYFLAFIFLERLGGMSLSLELPRKSLWSLGSISNLCLAYLRRYSSSDHLPICILLINSWVWTIHYHSFVLRLLYSQPRPKAQYMIWALNPTIAHQNFIFFLSSEEKTGVLNL